MPVDYRNVYMALNMFYYQINMGKVFTIEIVHHWLKRTKYFQLRERFSVLFLTLPALLREKKR